MSMFHETVMIHHKIFQYRYGKAYSIFLATTPNENTTSYMAFNLFYYCLI